MARVDNNTYIYDCSISKILSNVKSLDFQLFKASRKFITARKILEAYEMNEFFGLIIYGEQSIGKTTYMLKVMYEVYRNWDLVFKHLVFSFDDLVDIIKNNDQRFVVIGWDDAGIHGHKYRYFRSRESVELISAWLDAIRTQVSALLITTVNPLNLLKPIRDSLGMRYGKVIRHKDIRRYARVYSQTVLPDGKKILKLMFIDCFKARLPDHVYEKYLEKRNAFYRETKERLIEAIEKYNDKKLREEFD
jgi:hypothetical protein